MASLFDKGWIDMVFEGRNKKYGAYQLRSENPKVTMIALLIGALFFTAVVAAPYIYGKVKNNMDKTEVKEKEIIQVVDIPDEEIVELPPEPPKVEQVQAPKSLVEEVKFKPLEAAKKEEIKEEAINIDDLKDKNPSNQNKEADLSAGDINIGAYAGDLDKGVEPKGEDDGVYVGATLQVKPDFPGGINAFRKFVGDNFRTPDLDRDMDLKIHVSFVVEKDGSLTAIKILKDPGYGAGKEAERVLKSLKTKWSPGEQNGKKVRSSFTMPITIRVKSS
ncbi:MAG: energy transducer TonB [Bacteroidota bacterium]